VVDRIQKVLEGANIKLSAVASDVVGASGRAMLKAMVSGVEDPQALADMVKGRLRQKRSDLIVVPHSAAGIALLFVFGEKFFLGKAFHAIGIDFVDATAGVVIAMLFVSIPFLVDSAKEGYRKVDSRMEKVARTLGASPWQAFFKISLPLAWRSILAGSIMMWARG
jgi:molybdate/tungstate transport system permease protein